MNDLQYVISMLQTANKAAVARVVGLSSRTLRDIASGRQQKPSYETIRKLTEHFRGKGEK